MIELHLTFFTSENRKHKEILKNIKEDITKEEVMDLMKTMVTLDLPNAQGRRSCARPAAAKIVETKIHVLFDDMKEARKNFPRPKPVAKPKPAAKAATPKKTEVSISEMTRFSPTKTAEIMLNNMVVNGANRFTIAHYLANALKTQFINNVLTVDKQIDPYLFNPVMKKIFSQPTWSNEMVAFFSDLQDFFTPDEWLATIKHGQVAGREAAARLAGGGTFANYREADETFKVLLAEAETALAASKQTEKALQQQLQRLVS